MWLVETWKSIKKYTLFHRSSPGLQAPCLMESIILCLTFIRLCCLCRALKWTTEFLPFGALGRYIAALGVKRFASAQVYISHFPKLLPQTLSPPNHSASERSQGKREECILGKGRGSSARRGVKLHQLNTVLPSDNSAAIWLLWYLYLTFSYYKWSIIIHVGTSMVI